MTIQNARSNVSGRIPASLQDGQIAINQADGVLFSRNPDGTVKRNLLAKRTGVSDAAFSARFFDTYIGISSLTASRAIALPAASAYPPGSPLTIADESGAVSPTVTLTIAPNGADKINGAGSLALATAFGGVLLYSDGTSKWTAIALPAGAASNALLYVQQSLTGGQQDQARANIGGAMAASPSATATLVALDFDRDQFVTGSSTITMPSAVAPGWRSGIVANTNPVTGLVTLAVPSGHSLDGTTNGVTILFPFQRARLALVSAGVWRTLWIERLPVVSIINATSSIASADINLPVGYSRFRFAISSIAAGTSGASLVFRASDNGTANIKAGSTDYAYQLQYAAPASSGFGQTLAGFGAIALNLGASANPKASANGLIMPGATGEPGVVTSTAYLYDTNPQRNVYNIGSDYIGSTSGAIGRWNLLRLLFTAGTGTFNATITGEP